MEKPYTGLTAAILLNGTILGYMNNVELSFDRTVVEIMQFSAQYKEKLPAIKNWTASVEGTVAFEAGGSQEKLYLAFESGEFVTLRTELAAGVYFEGDALISTLSISGTPDEAMSISAEFEGSGANTLVLPETVNVTISSSVGGTTNPAGIVRVAKGGTLTVTCIPSAGMKAATYELNSGGATDITGNTFTTAAISTESTIKVVFTENA